MQACIVDLVVTGTGDLLDAFHLDSRTVHPAGRLAQRLTLPTRFALDQVHRACSGGGTRFTDKPRHAQVVGDAPLFCPFLDVQGGRIVDGEELGEVEADTAGPDDSNGLSDCLVAEHSLRVRHHLGVVDTGDVGHARGDAGRHDDVVELLVDQFFSADPGVQVDVDSGRLELGCEVPDGLGELFFPGNPRCDRELTADVFSGLVQVHLVPPPCGGDRSRQSGRPSTHHGDALGLTGGAERERGLASCAGIDQARHLFADESMVEARLVAGDARVDLGGPPGLRLVGELGVGQ